MGLFSALICAGCLHARADLHSVQVRPEDTSAHIQTIDGNNRAYWNARGTNHLLLISLGGTNSKPQDFEGFDRTAAEHGFHVLAIDYSNKVITTICRDLGQAGCFDKFHRAIILGQQVSPQVQVDSVNSIIARVRAMMHYMAARDPQWAEFIKDGDLDWPRVWIVGHSQGSGHSAYLSKLFPFGRVILIAGPQDSFKNGQVDAWVHEPGRTAPGNYYSLLHKDDFFDSRLQINAFRQLGGQDAHLLLVHDPEKDPHNSLLTSHYEEEWNRLLTPEG